MDKYRVAATIIERLRTRAESIPDSYRKRVVLDKIKYYLADAQWLSLAKYKEYTNAWYIGMLDSSGNREGSGALLLHDGYIYIGHWHYDEMWDDEDGIRLQIDNGIYIGNFRNGDIHGNCYVHYPYGSEYEAEFENGREKKRKRERYADGVMRNSKPESGGLWGCLVIVIIIIIIISIISR